jgi:transposase InsO family protein
MVMDTTNTVHAVALMSNSKLYTLEGQSIRRLNIPSTPMLRDFKIPSKSKALAITSEETDLLKWHERFNHLNFNALCTMARCSLIRGFPTSFPSTNPYCPHCAYGKLSVEPFPQKSSTVITRPLQLVVTDVCGEFSLSIGGKCYFVIFMDVYSRYMWIYFIKKKSEVTDCLKQFHKLAEHQSGQSLLTIRSDNAKEIIEGSFANYCKSEGIARESTAPYSSASNGLAE